jgi:hypothetical protein
VFYRPGPGGASVWGATASLLFTLGALAVANVSRDGQRRLHPLSRPPQLSHLRSPPRRTMAALNPDGTPNLYSVAGNQIHAETIAKQIRQDSSWWAKHRHVADMKFQYAVGAIPDKKKIVYPKLPQPVLGKAAATDVDEAALSKMSTMQADFFFAQSSEVWDWYRETGYLQKKQHNKKGLPDCARTLSNSPFVMRRPSSLHAAGCALLRPDYGATLHATSADGTDFSSRAH